MLSLRFGVYPFEPCVLVAGGTKRYNITFSVNLRSQSQAGLGGFSANESEEKLCAVTETVAAGIGGSDTR